MRFEISDEAASTFAGRVYSAIAQGFPIDAAMAAVASDAQAVVTLNRNQTPTTATAAQTRFSHQLSIDPGLADETPDQRFFRAPCATAGT